MFEMIYTIIQKQRGLAEMFLTMKASTSEEGSEEYGLFRF
jgi:hypothetical protein